MSEEIVLSGAEEQLRVRLLRPADARGSALLLDGGPGAAPALAARLAGEGHLVGLLAGGAGSGERARVRDLAAVARRLGREPGIDGDRVGLVGLGSAAATALLAGCTQRGLAAVATIGGRVVHAELSAERPVQPVEMLHGLDAPLFVAFGSEAGARGEDALLREALASAAKRAEVLALAVPEARLLAVLGSPAAGAAGGVWDALTRFLAEHLA